MANNFQRLFYIFKNMDRDEGCPTGYIRVEVNGDKAKLQISLSNLVNRKDLGYQVYGIKKTGKQLAYTVVCNVPNDNGRADIKMDMDINNVGSNKLRLEDINIFAVTTHLSGRTPSIKYPLVAYTKGEILWRDEFEDVLLNQELYSKNSDERNNVIINNSNTDIKIREANTNKESLHNSVQPGSVTDNLSGRADEIKQFEQKNRESEVLEDPVCRQTEPASDAEDIDGAGADNEADTLNSDGGEPAEADRNTDAGMNFFQDGKEADRDICSETVIVDKQVSEDIQDGKSLQRCFDELERTIDSKADTPVQNDTGYYRNTQFSISDKFESAVTSVYNADRSAQADQERKSVLALDDNDMGSIEYKDLENISAVHTGSGKSIFNMPSLKEELNKSFESYNPFKMKSKNFVWWKINSPGYLNNILFRNNIRTYLLFNPKVMLAHYKYRYIILGIRNDRRSGREYLICGVPGVYDIDQNPFGNMGSWAQTEGFKPKYGAFGYWIIMIDPRTGKLMKVK